MKFVNGSAFLNHLFIKLGWVSDWIKIFPKEELEFIFSSVEKKLKSNGLILTIPMAFMEGEKI